MPDNELIRTGSPEAAAICEAIGLDGLEVVEFSATIDLAESEPLTESQMEQVYEQLLRLRNLAGKTDPEPDGA